MAKQLQSETSTFLAYIARAGRFTSPKNAVLSFLHKHPTLSATVYNHLEYFLALAYNRLFQKHKVFSS